MGATEGEVPTVEFISEQRAGNLPVWLSPEQARVIPITDSQNDYAVALASRLEDEGIRAGVDLDPGRMNAKIRNAQLMKIPYMLVVGEQETTAHTVSLRKRDGSRADGMPVAEFIAHAGGRSGRGRGTCSGLGPRRPGSPPGPAVSP